jgi:flagellar assembly factor FliW
MARFETQRLGTVDYEENAVVHFPAGLPAFDTDTRFVLIERPEMAPVIFLQSLIHPELCFFSVPAVYVDRGFRLQAPAEELEAIGGDGDLLCLALLTLREDRPPTANLMAPVVIHRGARLGRQIIQYDSGYQFEHPLREDPDKKEEPC